MTALRDDWGKIIAHAWKNPAFMKALKSDPKAAIESVKVTLGLTAISSDFFPIPEPPLSPTSTEDELKKYIEDDNVSTALFGKMKLCCV